MAVLQPVKMINFNYLLPLFRVSSDTCSLQLSYSFSRLRPLIQSFVMPILVAVIETAHPRWKSYNYSQKDNVVNAFLRLHEVLIRIFSKHVCSF